MIRLERSCSACSTSASKAVRKEGEKKVNEGWGRREEVESRWRNLYRAWQGGTMTCWERS